MSTSSFRISSAATSAARFGLDWRFFQDDLDLDVLAVVLDAAGEHLADACEHVIVGLAETRERTRHGVHEADLDRVLRRRRARRPNG